MRSRRKGLRLLPEEQAQLEWLRQDGYGATDSEVARRAIREVYNRRQEHEMNAKQVLNQFLEYQNIAVRPEEFREMMENLLAGFAAVSMRDGYTSTSGTIRRISPDPDFIILEDGRVPISVWNDERD